MNRVVLKEKINVFIDNIDEIRLNATKFNDNYKYFIIDNKLTIEEQKHFTNQLLNHFNKSFFENNVYSDEFSNDMIELLNIELNDLNQKETSINDDSKDNDEHLSTHEKKNRIKLSCFQNNIAYLFYALRKNEIIECQNLAKALSNIFINEDGKPIKNDFFNSCFNKFNDKEYPSNAKVIDVFVKDFKKV